LTQTDENPAHGLEIKAFVAAEDKNEAPKLYTKRFD